MNKTIGVIGCGWLGFPLAQDLLKSGYTIKGTTTSSSKLKSLKLEGIDSYQIKLNENRIDGDIQDFLSGIDILLINVPPGLRKNKSTSYISKIRPLLSEIENAIIKNVVFISSTSVYGNIAGDITEDSKPKPETESGKQLLECEKLFLNHKNINTTVIRFGGLIGPNRHPVNQLSGKKGLKNGEALVNLIHLNDCIHMIKTIIENEYWNTIFNGVYPEHPSRKKYYTSEAIKRNLPLPEFMFSLTKVIKKSIICRNFLIKSHFLYTSIFS